MGALFRLRHEYFQSFAEYRGRNPQHEVFTFMLNGERPLTVENCPKPGLFCLVFGNEATGLDDSYLSAGTSIMDAEADRRPKDRAHISHIPRINKYQLRPGSIQLLRIFLKYTDNKNILLVAQAGNKLVVYGQGNTAGAAESGKLLCIGKKNVKVSGAAYEPARKPAAGHWLKAACAAD